MQCRECRKTHRELPDFIIPYKRTELDEYCEIAEADAENYPCETSTWLRLKAWLAWFIAYAQNVELGLACAGLLKTTMDSVCSLADRTAYFVRLVVNSGNWIHNRSAMSVA